MEPISDLIDAARAAAQYERDDIGSPWCGVCHRTVADCDAKPDEHFSEDLNTRLNGFGCSFRPNERLCPGHHLRVALRGPSGDHPPRASTAKLDELLRFDGIGRNLLELRIVALARLVRVMLRLCPSLQQTVNETVAQQLTDEGHR